jgi:predicted kinase
MLCQAKCEKLMDEGAPVIVVANTNVRERDVNGYTKMGKQHGYTVFSIIVENRHGGQNEHGVPDEMIANMAKNFSVKLS